MRGWRRGCLDILYSMPNPLLWYASIAATVFLVYRFVLDARLAVRGGPRRNRGDVAPLDGVPRAHDLPVLHDRDLAVPVAGAHLRSAARRGGGVDRVSGARRDSGSSSFSSAVAVLLSIFWYPLWSAMQVPYEFYRLHNWMQGWV
jgi:hypothetical protein